MKVAHTKQRSIPEQIDDQNEMLVDIHRSVVSLGERLIAKDQELSLLTEKYERLKQTFETVVTSWDDGEGDTEVELINDSGITTKIYYQAKEQYFYVNYRRYFRYPLTEEDIDGLLEGLSKSGWERYDTTDVAKLKDIMAKLAR